MIGEICPKTEYNPPLQLGTEEYINVFLKIMYSHQFWRIRSTYTTKIWHLFRICLTLPLNSKIGPVVSLEFSEN